MTITTLQAAAQADPRLRGLPVELCEHARYPVAILADVDHAIECPECSASVDPRTILVCTEAGEVAEMCAFLGTCWECLGPCHHQERIYENCCDRPNPVDVESRLFLWDGEPVDWEAVLPEPARYEAEQRGSELHNPRLVNPLAAVVLVAKDDTYWAEIATKEDLSEAIQAYEEAREACAQAGVGFHVLGDGTAVAL